MKEGELLIGPEGSLRADAVRSRRRVVAAAQRLLAEDPQASMDAIAKAAGVGRSTVFRHFLHRDDLVRVVWLDAAAQAAREVEALDPAGLDPDAAVDHLIDASVAATERYPILLRGARPPIDDPDVTAQFGAAEAVIASALQRAITAGVLRADMSAAVLTEHLLGTTQAVVLAGLTGAAARTAARSLFRSGASPSMRP